MKKISLIFAMLILCGAASAQQPVAKQNHAPEAAIPMSTEDSAKLAEVAQVSQKYAEANSKLVSACRDYNSQQAAFQAEFDRRAARAAIAAHLTLEQLDNSDLKLDEKGNYVWVLRAKTESAKAPK